MRSKGISLCLLVSLIAGSAIAQDTTATKKTETIKLRSYAEIIPARAISSKGLFGIHKVDDKYYFEIPDSLLGRELLFTTRLVKVPTGSPLFGGDVVNSIIVSFEKASEDKLYLRVITNVAIADSSNAIAKAVRNSTVDPIAMVMDIKAKGKERKSSVVDMSDFILKDNNITGFDPNAKKFMALGGVAPDRSSILAVNAFPENIEVKTMKTFSVGGGLMPSAGAADAEPAASASMAVTMELSTSVMLVPNKAMAARYFDPRIGYYSENYKVFSDNQQKVDDKNFIVRQRLEPKPEDIERYKRGELVEPKEPIVYYVDPSTPKQWRPYIIAGINDWNEAFKAAGFKNAIIGKEWPENDSTMSMEDVRCKVIRYFPSNQPDSRSARIYDPRSGEILQTYIGWSNSRMQALHDWYFIQASAIDPNARKMKFSTELMGALIRADIAREVGQTLGLRSNLKGSMAYAIEKLRDKNWVEANGISASIMDFNNYNYVAQPSDNISIRGLVPRIGEYDKWAIKYGYTYTGKNDFDEDKKVAEKWLADASANASLKYGAETRTSLLDPTDPSAQLFDLGSDHVKAGEYAIKNLKITTANLLAWTKEDLDMYDNAASMYDQVCDWVAVLGKHACAEIGGVKEDLKTVEQSGDIYTPSSRDMQKKAVAFLNKEIFQTPVWLLDANLLNKFRKPNKKEKAYKIQESIMYRLLDAERIYRMTTETMRFGKENTYTIDEFLTDLNKGVWSELKTGQPVIVDQYRRMVQKNTVVSLIKVYTLASTPPGQGSTATDMSNSDVPVVVKSQLQKIEQQCNAAIAGCKDEMTMAHLKYVSEKIHQALNPKK
jgi:hypothetical protein